MTNVKHSVVRKTPATGSSLHTSKRKSSRVRVFRNFRTAAGLNSEAIEDFYQAINTPVSLSLAILFRNGMYREIADYEIDPSRYNDPDLFKLDFAAVSFLRKADFIETGLDLEKIAIDNFVNNEVVCKATNNVFRNLALSPDYKGDNVWLLDATSRKIAQILGDFDGEEFFDSGFWGPGASTKITGRDTSAVRKFRDENEITATLYRLVGPLMSGAYPNWFRDGHPRFEIRESSKLLTVPKNARTDRTIAIEPGFNIWFQKSVGKMIRRRLRRYGFDLNSDERNQQIARSSSLDGLAATVDFSSASDTIAYHLVRELFPPRWFALLEACRTKSYTHKAGEPVFLEKFSSMGNGFTFELESLIFLAAAQAVTEKFSGDSSLVSVFGDDVTLDAKCFRPYVEFTKFLGFTVNARKSFSSGYFRESCGSYFFAGICCKPYFHRKCLYNAKSIFKLVNGLRNLAHRHRFSDGCDVRFRSLYLKLVDCLPAPLRVLGNRESGDCCIHANFDEAAPTLLRHQSWEGFSHAGFVEVPVQLEADDHAVLLARLKQATKDRASGNLYELRSVTRSKFSRIFVHQWYNFGPWF